MTKTTSSLGGTSDEPSAAVGMAEFGRAAVTAAVLGRHGGRVAIGALKGQGATPLAAVEAKTAFAELGPTYVKLAQMIASSPGLFPEVLANEFRSLLDEVPPVGEEDVRRVVLRELGDQPENLFKSFDLQPLASASIAQVHAATLPDGEDVVVKIQRPGIRAGVQQDLRILMLVARLLERTSASGRMANPIGIVEDFEVTLGEELNFVHEARGMELFEHNLRAFGDNDTVRVPAVHWRYTTPRVLTMERIHGYKIDDLAQLGAKGWDLAGALKRAVRAWLEGALQHGFFHGDAHAGNLMIDTEGKVVFLDFGITGHLDDKTREVIRTGLPALLVNRDFRTVATSIYELGAVLSPLDLDQASKDIAALVEPILEKPLSEISYGQVLVDIVKVGTGYGVRLPRDLILVAKQLLYFERYAKLMAPDWSILNDPELIGFLFESVVETTVA